VDIVRRGEQAFARREAISGSADRVSAWWVGLFPSLLRGGRLQKPSPTFPLGSNSTWQSGGNWTLSSELM
jgi:hypothetical protein